jgi:broad specificity phosphatase PhoE
MQILLLRHGKPRIDHHQWLTPAEFGRWVAEYDAAGIDPDHRPPSPVLDQAAGCPAVVCSPLPRSIESARALGVGNVAVPDALFREVDMPCAPLRRPRLPSSAWAVLFRLMWTAGYSANAEPLTAARRRADDCVRRLTALAAEHGSVLLVGHGSMNWLIARRLKRQGWSGPPRAPMRYWGMSTYRLPHKTFG